MEGQIALLPFAEYRKPQNQFDLISIAGEEPDANPRTILTWLVFPPEGVLSPTKSIDDSTGDHVDGYVISGPSLSQGVVASPILEHGSPQEPETSVTRQDDPGQPMEGLDEQGAPAADANDHLFMHAPDSGTSDDQGQELDHDEDDAWLAKVGMSNLRYEFRTTARQQQDATQFFFYDEDKTGNYDTDEERRQNRVHRKRKARAHPTQQDDSAGEANDARQTKRLRIEDRRMFTIKLTQEDIVERARTYFDTIAQAEQQRLQELQSGEYLLRQRPRDRDGLDTPNVKPGLQGHPAGRGCTECLSIGAHCSAVDNEFDWPCSSCVREKAECTPAVPPKRKAACSNCLAFGARKKKMQWLVCSNLYDEDQGDCCRQCEKNGEGSTCVALPDLSEVHQRVRIDKDEKPYVNDRPDGPTSPVRTSCLQCQATERNCSFDGKNDITEACVSCQMGKLTCQPVTTDKTAWIDAERTQHPRTHTLPVESTGTTTKERASPVIKQEHAVAGSQAFVPSAEIIEISDDSDDDTASGSVAPKGKRAPKRAGGPATKKPIPIIGKKGASIKDVRSLPIMKMFRTKLCHPVVFNHDDFPDEARPCDFCDHPAYAIIGKPLTRVLVRKLPNGRGWEECRAEPARGSLQNTVVCISCTDRRLGIMQCLGHDMEAMDLPPRDIEYAWQRLKAGFADNKWCSICCNLATHYCCRVNAATGNALSAYGEKGCGLMTCDACTLSLEAWEWDLQKMLFSLDDKMSDKRPEGLRADWCLLKQGEILDNFMKNQ